MGTKLGGKSAVNRWIAVAAGGVLVAVCLGGVALADGPASTAHASGRCHANQPWCERARPPFSRNKQASAGQNLHLSRVATLDWWGGPYGGQAYHFGGGGGIAFDGTHLWVTSFFHDSVTEVNASDGSLVRVISGSAYGFGSPNGVAFDGTHIWVTDLFGNAVTEINAGDGSLVRVLSSSSYAFKGPGSIAFDGTGMWVVNDHSVTELPAA